MEKDKHMNKNAEETHDETPQDKLIERLIARIKNPSGRKNDGTDSEPQEENSADENSCGSEEKPEKQKIRDVIHRFRKITARETTEDEEEIPEIIHLPEIQTEYPVIDRYWLNPPYAHAAVCKTAENDLRYLIFEPEITDSEYLILEETFEYLRSTIIYGKTEENEAPSLPPALLKKTLLAFEKTLTSDRIRILSYYLTRNFLGYGKLDPLLHDDKIEDITCNGPNLPLYLYHRKYGNIQTNCIFKTEELNKTVLKLAQKADKQISLSSPLVDAALPNGARVQLTYSDIISDKGSSFTIRKFKTEPMTPTELIASNTYSAELMAHIALAVENRKSIIIAGGTASGKTSTMNAASFFIPHSAKIVSLEDTREIQLPHTNWLPLKTRENQAVETTGDISMFSSSRLPTMMPCSLA
ncbi:MAG: type II/IV secretion system ATPase subunit [Methanocorpusculum sp.]|nr:type II/IV secretion system ATPase subunit [Methanocorpusculum sp.]